MSQSDFPHSSETGRASAPDPQALVGLLESLVPLLVRLQSQTAGHPFPFLPPDPLIQSNTLDHQAAVAFAEDLIAGALRDLSTYLEANTSRYPGLEPCTGIINLAKQTFAARDYAQSFALILQAYRAITALRAVRPELPPIRGTGQAGSSSATSVH
jgi:hypothetical protein